MEIIFLSTKTKLNAVRKDLFLHVSTSLQHRYASNCHLICGYKKIHNLYHSYDTLCMGYIIVTLLVRKKQKTSGSDKTIYGDNTWLT